MFGLLEPLWSFFVVVLISLCVILITAVALLVAFMIIDLAFLPKKVGLGRVVGKEYRANNAHIYPMDNTVMIVNDVHVWVVEVEVEGQLGRISVSRKVYDGLREGVSVQVEYALGRISGDLYIKKFSDT